MTAWLKKNWFIVVVGIVVLVLLYGGIDGLIAKITYKKQIREKDVEISELQQGIKDSKKREEAWIKSSNENYALAMEKEAKLREKDREMMKKIAEKRELKKKIKEMPASVVVVRTIEIIQCDEIREQLQGIVFSLDCSKKNLTFLEESLFLKREIDDWRNQYLTSQAEVVDLKNVIIDKDEAYAERGIQLTSAYEIIDNWEDKFNLSEKRGKRSWWKGLKTGGTIGGIVGFLAGLFLGGR